jgi:hypothetical protein
MMVGEGNNNDEKEMREKGGNMVRVKHFFFLCCFDY